MKRPKYKDKEKGEIDFYEISLNIIKEINKVRSDPSSYIDLIEKDKGYFKQNIIYRPEEEPMSTEEGEDAYNELIDFLSSQESLEEVEVDEKITSACNEKAKEITENPELFFQNESNFIGNLIENYGEWDSLILQILEYGTKNARDIVINLLASDNDKTRSSRSSIFNKDVKFIGCACVSNKEYGIISYICLVQNIRELDSSPPELEEPSTQVKPVVQEDWVEIYSQNRSKTVNNELKEFDQVVYNLPDGSLHVVERIDQ